MKKVGALTAAASLGYVGLRAGYFGDNEIVVQDTKWRQHTLIREPSLFVNKFTVIDRSRIDTMIQLEYDLDTHPLGSAPAWLNNGIRKTHWSFKPFRTAVVPFDNEQQLVNHLLGILARSREETKPYRLLRKKRSLSVISSMRPSLSIKLSWDRFYFTDHRSRAVLMYSLLDAGFFKGRSINGFALRANDHGNQLDQESSKPYRRTNLGTAHFFT